MVREQAASILDDGERTEALIRSTQTEQLAVLATFDPGRLTSGDGADILRRLCRRLPQRDGLKDAILVEGCRVDVLATILRRGGADELRRVRNTVTPDYNTPMQRMLDAFVAGTPLPVDTNDENDLLAALEVSRWADVAIAQARYSRALRIEPPRDELESRLALLHVTRPVRRLLAAGCVGREVELRRLHHYRLSPGTQRFVTDPAMVVHGIGGIGKSTLIARFVMDLYELSGEADRWAWAYLDLDRPTLSSGDPFVVLVDVIDQVSAQFPTRRRQLNRLRQTAHDRTIGSGLEQTSHQSLELVVREFADALRLLNVGSMIVVVDTIELLDRADPDTIRGLSVLFDSLSSAIPTFRLVVSGRGPAQGFADPTRPDLRLHVLPLAEDSAVQLLHRLVGESGIDIDDTLAHEIISLVGGIPLTVRLAATVLAREGPDAVTAAARARAVDRVRSEIVRGFLYHRILEHITLPDDARTAALRAVAKVGLVLRWITPQLLERVLIPAAGISPVADLFADLGSDVTLVENEGDLLRLREELRGPALAALALEDPRMVERVHRAAAEYFAKDSSSGAAVEYAYHKLALGEPVLALTQSTLRRLEVSVADLPPMSVAFVRQALDNPVARSGAEDLLAWERKTLSQANAALSNREYELVRALLDERTERSSGSELHAVESRLEEALRHMAAATDSARRELTAAEIAGNAVRLAGSAVRLAGLLEWRQLAAEAATTLRRTADSQLLAGYPDLRLELMLNRMTLLERRGLLSADDRWSAGLHVRELLQQSGPKTNTAITRLLAAALGREEPERLRAAARAVGLGYNEDQLRVHTLLNALATWDNARPDPGQLARQLRLEPVGSDLGTIALAWTGLAGLGTEAGSLLDLLWTMAAPPLQVREALRAIYLWWEMPTNTRELTPMSSPSFLTDYPIDWSLPETRQLEEILLTAYPRQEHLQRLADSAGLDSKYLNRTGSSRRIVRDLIEMASRTGHLDQVIGAILSDPNATSVHVHIRSLVGDDWIREHNLTEQNAPHPDKATTVLARIPAAASAAPSSGLSATAAAVLGLLHDGPATGSQLVAGAGERFGAFFSVTRSQVYRELPALSKGGLVRLGNQGPRSSQQYVLTAAGKKTFKAWLISEAGPDHLRKPFILRLVHADSLTAKQRKSLFESARASYSQQLDDAKTAKKSADGPYEKAIAEFAHSQARAALKLLDTIAKQ